MEGNLSVNDLETNIQQLWFFHFDSGAKVFVNSKEILKNSSLFLKRNQGCKKKSNCVDEPTIFREKTPGKYNLFYE